MPHFFLKLSFNREFLKSSSIKSSLENTSTEYKLHEAWFHYVIMACNTQLYFLQLGIYGFT